MGGSKKLELENQPVSAWECFHIDKFIHGPTICFKEQSKGDSLHMLIKWSHMENQP